MVEARSGHFTSSLEKHQLQQKKGSNRRHFCPSMCHTNLGNPCTNTHMEQGHLAVQKPVEFIFLGLFFCHQVVQEEILPLYCLDCSWVFFFFCVCVEGLVLKMGKQGLTFGWTQWIEALVCVFWGRIFQFCCEILNIDPLNFFFWEPYFLTFETF